MDRTVGRPCKICASPMELSILADTLMDQGRSFREISGLLSMTGRHVSFMSVARHKKHYQPGLTGERRLDMLKLEYVKGELEKLRRKFSGIYGRRF